MGIEQFDIKTWALLKMLHTREISGYDAQVLVNTHTKELTKRSSLLFQRILKKDLRMGTGIKSINKAFPGLIPTHDVMKAKPHFEIHRVRYPCFGSPKIDGVRSKFKRGKFYSRNGHEYVGLEHLQSELSEITEEIDGELVVPNVSFQVGSGWIRSDDPTPDAEFRIIELPTIKDSLATRITMMADLVFDGIWCVPRTTLSSETEIYDYYVECRRSGYEGAIITPYDYEYTGTRSWNWMKLKPLETYDAKVIDIYEGKGKYVGQMGGAIVMFHGKPNKVGSGWSDNQRKAFWEKPMALISKMIEVHYMEKTDDGNMRHSRFHGFRPDKEV
jgi:DNA ligase-1